MRVFYIFILFFGLIANGQTLSIPDANFKAKLLAANTTNTIAKNIAGNYFKVDANSDGEIQLSEAVNVRELYVSNSSISSMSGIESFSGLRLLKCENNNLTTLPVQNLPILHFLYCGYNQLTQINIPTSLLGLYCYHNAISSIDLAGKTNLIYLQIHHNQLVTIDTSVLASGNGLDVNCSYNNLVTMFVKNGGFSSFDFDHNPQLEYICVDESEAVAFKGACVVNGNTACEVNSYCSFTPGGNSYKVQGINKLDSDTNGCSDSDMIYPALKFSIAGSSSNGSHYSNQTGSYKFSVPQGVHTITPVLENPGYFSISPTVLNVNFPSQTSPYISNFCVTPNGSYPDIDVTILPLEAARPGFNAKYKILYRNKGTVTLSGTLYFSFQEDRIDFVASSVSPGLITDGTLAYIYTNLKPFQTESIVVTLNINAPTEIPAVNAGDALIFNIHAPSVPDNTPGDNFFSLTQMVVNSFDPNDKLCLQGKIIPLEMVGKYINYIIHFENTGTANAQNIVVKDMIDTTKFDVSSLIPLDGSHLFETRITGNNKVEFIFENINLPFDDANNDGYVAFKIKTKPTLVVGDTFSNSASIYFDYNAPIVTEPATTTVQVLGTEDFSLENYFTLYPNPVSNTLNIAAKQGINVSSFSIYNILGQLIMALPNAGSTKDIDVSNIPAGNYFLKIISDKGTTSVRFIKK